MNNSVSSVAGLSGLGDLCIELYNSALFIRWSLSRDLVFRFYLLFHLFETTRRNARVKEAGDKYRLYEDRVQSFKMEIDQIRGMSSRTQAENTAQAIFGQMKIIMDELKLDPSDDPTIGRHWRRAQADSHRFASVPATSVSTPSPVRSDLVRLMVYISLNPHGPFPDLSAPSPRPVVFPAKFGRFSFPNFLAFALANPKNTSDNPQNVHHPIPFSALNILYLRSMNSSNQPAHWDPIVLYNKLTVQDYLDTKSHQEIRFLSSKIRFVLVSSNESGKHVEKTFDLDRMNEREEMERLLGIGAYASPAASSSRSVRSSNQKLLPSSSKGCRDFLPGTCIVHTGPGNFQELSPNGKSVYSRPSLEFRAREFRAESPSISDDMDIDSS